jgi:hypothetical protein
MPAQLKINTLYYMYVDSQATRDLLIIHVFYADRAYKYLTVHCPTEIRSICDI